MKITEGSCLDAEQREALAKKIGRTLPDEVWAHSVSGHRILICPEPVSDRFKGLIYKPRSATEREGLEMGAGWIIAVGPLAGSGDDWFPGGLFCKEPQDLLGLHVIFKSHSGVTIRTNEEDDEWGGKAALLVMTTRDILMVGEGL
jgi:hypothetical protein